MSQTFFIVLIACYTALIPLGILGWQIYSWRVVWRPGYHRIIITDEDKVIHSLLLRLDLTATNFTVKIAGQSHTFGIDTDCVRYIGRFRIPTYEYLAGNAAPLLIREDRIDHSEKISSIQFNDVAKNVAMAQLLAAFRKGIMNPVNIMLVGFVIVVIVIVAASAYQVNELSTIKDAMGIAR